MFLLADNSKQAVLDMEHTSVTNLSHTYNTACSIPLRPLKRVSCSYCGKLFRDKWTLERHHRVHTGVKPFVCSVCGRGFSQKVSMKFHYSKHFE